MPAPIDGTMRADATECAWCGREAATVRFGSRYRGQMHWSSPMCSTACHDEATTEWVPAAEFSPHRTVAQLMGHEPS